MPVSVTDTEIHSFGLSVSASAGSGGVLPLLMKGRSCSDGENLLAPPTDSVSSPGFSSVEMTSLEKRLLVSAIEWTLS